MALGVVTDDVIVANQNNLWSRFSDERVRGLDCDLRSDAVWISDGQSNRVDSFTHENRSALDGKYLT